MDISLASLGVDVGVIIGTIFIAQFIKKFLNELKIRDKIKKFFVFIPLVLAIIASLVVTKPLMVQEFFKNIILYTGASSYLYNNKKLFLKKEEKASDT